MYTYLNFYIIKISLNTVFIRTYTTHNEQPKYGQNLLFFTFWERGETLRKYILEIKFVVVRRSIKRLTIPENIINV